MLKKSFSKAKPVCKVTFSLPFEAVRGGSDVRVLGDFNNWSWQNGYRMKAAKGEFSTEVELEAGKEYQFRYLIDNHLWENDWKADNYVQSPFDGIANSVLSLVAETVTNGEPKKVAAKTVATPAAEAAPAAKTAAAKPAAAPKAAAKTVAADDLAKIEGIGPKIVELLNAAGIVTFADLAKAKTATLKGILDAAGKKFQMHDPGTWAEQAALAAKGDWAAFEKLTKSLKAGKR
ncbi:MAG: DUF4332 domain-containing protein [Bacteroidota bacterium]